MVATEKHGALKTIMRTLDGIPGVMYEKRWGNAYEGPGKADITGAIQVPFGASPSGSLAWRFEIEAKRPGEEMRPLQKARMREWTAIGVLGGQATTREDVLTILAPALALRGG